MGSLWKRLKARVAATFKWEGWNVVAALGTLFAAIAAWQAAKAARDAPRRQATFEARHEALRDYVQAEGQLHAILITDPLDLPFNIDDASTFGDERELHADAQVARATVDKYYAYATAANMSRSVWSSDIEDAIINAGAAANTALACYKELSSYSIITNEGADAAYLSSYRDKMQKDCGSEHQKTDAFDDASNAVIAMMVKDMDSSWSGK